MKINLIIPALFKLYRTQADLMLGDASCRLVPLDYQWNTVLTFGKKKTRLMKNAYIYISGIFQPHIQYLLCLATPVDIVLLGASFTSNEAGMLVTLILPLILLHSLTYKTRFHLIFRFPAWSKRNIILTVAAQSNHFLLSKAIDKHFSGGNL